MLANSIRAAGLADSLFDPVLNYLNFLTDKNTELNLFSRKLDAGDLITDHFLDCLAGWEFFKEYSSVTDLGSGGGLPGILLGIVFRDKKIVLVDKSVKKTMFLKNAVECLQMDNVNVVNDVVTGKIIKTEAVTCRAFKSIDEILGMTKDFFNRNGVYVLYKGTMQKINEELNEAGRKFRFGSTVKRVGLMKEKERHIVIIKK